MDHYFLVSELVLVFCLDSRVNTNKHFTVPLTIDSFTFLYTLFVDKTMVILPDAKDGIFVTQITLYDAADRLTRHKPIPFVFKGLSRQNLGSFSSPFTKFNIEKTAPSQN